MKHSRGKCALAGNLCLVSFCDQQVPDPPPGVDYPLDGGNILKIPGKIRFVVIIVYMRNTFLHECDYEY